MKGFTIIELLVVIFIFSLVAVGAGTIQRDSLVFSSLFQNELSSIDEGRKILRPLVGEVRSASASHTGAYALVETDDNSLIFYSDIDNDGLIERVRYFLDGTTFKKGIVEPSGSPLEYDLDDEKISWVIQNVANSVTEPLFAYYDSTYDGTTEALEQPVSVNAVRLIKITIIIDKDPTELPEAIELTTQMTVRNLKDNL